MQATKRLKTTTTEKHASKKSKLNRPQFFDYLLLVFMTFLGLMILYPFYNAVLVSLVSQADYLRTPLMLFPPKIDLSSYQFVLGSSAILDSMKVTVVVLVVGVAYNMLLTIMTAYALTKPFPGRKFVTYAIIFTMYFGGGLIPFYLLMKDLGLMDSILSMILPTGISFMYLTIIRNNFEAIPAELEESARIDGAGDFTILFKILLPLSLPILVTFSLYYGVERWNEWWNGMLFIKSFDKQPLQLVLRNIIMDAKSISSGASSDTMPFGDGVKMASMIVSMVPIMCVYPFLQRFFVTGLTVGAVKG